MEQASGQLGVSFVAARAWQSKGTYPLETVLCGSRRLVPLASLAAFVVRAAGLASAEQGAIGETTPPSAATTALFESALPAAPADKNEPQQRKRGRPCKAEAASIHSRKGGKR